MKKSSRERKRSFREDPGVTVMGKRIRKCRRCGRYTLSEKCPECGGDTGNPRPAPYAPSDPYAVYRRQYRAAVSGKEHPDDTEEP